MTEYVAQQMPIVEATLARRGELISALEQQHLEYRPAPTSPMLGDLCRESGAVQHAYIESFRTFQLRLPRVAAGPRSLAELAAWFTGLDAALIEVVSALTDDQLQRSVDRGLGAAPLAIHLHIYREALLIFYAKAQVYAKALGLALPEEFRWWLGDLEDLPEPETN